MKLHALFACLFISSLSLSSVFAQSKSPVQLHFDPAVEGGYPSLLVQPSRNSKEPNAIIHLTAYIVDTVNITTETKDIHPNEGARFILPNRGQRDVLGVKVESILSNKTTLLKEWRAIYLPNEKIMNYTGTDELQRPSDFDNYWKQAKEKLATTSMNAEIIPVPEKETKTGKLYKVKLNSYDDVSIICWYYVPKDVDPLSSAKPTKQYPAIQIMPGYGAEEPPLDRTADGFITLSLNPRGHGPSAEYFFVEAQHLWNILSPERYYYREAYMDCVRGIDFLTSRPEVDSHLIGAEGGSQGGAFALALAALDHRIACACANVPFISNIPDFVNVSISWYATGFKKYFADPSYGSDARQTLAYIDTANLSPWIQCPTMVCVGLEDPICPPPGGIVSYNRIPKNVPKRLITDPDASHEVTPMMRKANMDWYQKYLKNN
jgi:cephalosporin-C deacetylase-like acetyl esterase